MRGWRRVTLSLFIATSLLTNGAEAQWPRTPILRPKLDFQILKLFCSIREGSFLTQMFFKNQYVGDQLVLTAEVANYSISPLGSKKYLSGMVFAHVQYNANRITGDTGSTSDLKGRFILTRLDSSPQGRWGYVYYRTEFDVIRAVFNCSYNDSPYLDRQRRRY